MIVKDLIGLKDLEFKVNTEFEVDETYCVKGMVGVLKKAYKEEDYVIIQIDWEKYSDTNIPLESNDWYIGSGTDKTGSMKEANMYPKNGLEDLYVMIDDDLDIELISNTKSILLQEWKDSEDSKLSYLEWLEKQVMDSRV